MYAASVLANTPMQVFVCLTNHIFLHPIPDDERVRKLNIKLAVMRESLRATYGVSFMKWKNTAAIDCLLKSIFGVWNTVRNHADLPKWFKPSLGRKKKLKNNKQ